MGRGSNGGARWRTRRATRVAAARRTPARSGPPVCIVCAQLRPTVQLDCAIAGWELRGDAHPECVEVYMRDADRAASRSRSLGVRGAPEVAPQATPEGPGI